VIAMSDAISLNAEAIGPNSKTVSEVRSLRQKKHIIERGLFLIEGKKSVYETLCDKEFSRHVRYVVVGESIKLKFLEKISFINLNKYVKIYSVSDDLFNKISGDETPEGVLCAAAIPQRDCAGILSEPDKRLFIVLDSINDPGNLGTIMRLADNFGVSAVLLGKNSVFEYSPKVIKSSMGSFKNIAAARMDEKIYASVLDEVKKESAAVVCSDIKAEIPVSEAASNIKKRGLKKIFVIGGSESHGVISEEIKSLAGSAANLYRVKIKNYGKNESLNLSVAMGIFCYEMAAALYE